MKQIVKKKLNKDLLKYCEKMGISDVPWLIVKRDEMRSILRKEYGHSRTVLRGYYGKCFITDNIIFVNGGISRTYRHYRKTLVHELIHIKYTKMRHGRKFDRMTTDIIYH